MIDTIVLLLDNDQFSITQPDLFTPSARLVLNHGLWSSRGIRAKQNPAKAELRNGIYKPRLTLFRRINTRGVPEPSLKIEVSLPKLFFGDNFNELRYKQFPTLVEKLVSVLHTMGVVTSIGAITHAPVCSVHYSKNIALTDGSTTHYFISKIKEANITLALDINQTDYRNEGHSYKWHCNAYEVVFYDKIRDLEAAKKSDKRALEKDSELQLHLYEGLKQRHHFEILRMEVRVTKKQKLKALLAALGLAPNFTFKKLFKPALSKKVLLHYLDIVERKRPSLLDFESTDKALLATLLLQNPDRGLRQTLQLFGLKKILKTIPLRELRVMFAKYHLRSWYRLMEELSAVKVSLARSPLQIIRDHIVAFKPIQLPQKKEKQQQQPYRQPGGTK